MAEYSIKGSVFAIGAALAAKDSDFVAADFTTALASAAVVGAPETFGGIADEWETEEQRNATTGRTRTVKTGRKGKAMEITCALDPADAGQIAMRAAYDAEGNYACRFTFADKPATGTSPKNSTRVFLGCVTGVEDDPSGKIGKVKFTIAINSNVIVTNASAT